VPTRAPPARPARSWGSAPSWTRTASRTSSTPTPGFSPTSARRPCGSEHGAHQVSDGTERQASAQHPALFRVITHELATRGLASQVGAAPHEARLHLHRPSTFEALRDRDAHDITLGIPGGPGRDATSPLWVIHRSRVGGGGSDRSTGIAEGVPPAHGPQSPWPRPPRSTWRGAASSERQPGPEGPHQHGHPAMVDPTGGGGRGPRSSDEGGPLQTGSPPSETTVHHDRHPDTPTSG